MTGMPVLADELAAVRSELPRVDGKCSTLSGLTMAGIAFLTTQVRHGPILVRVLMATSGLMLAAATLVLLVAVIRPRLGTTGFRRYAGMSPTAVRRMLAEHDATEYPEHDLVVLSEITNRKYIGLKIATDLTAVAVLTAAAGLVAAVII